MTGVVAIFLDKFGDLNGLGCGCLHNIRDRVLCVLYFIIDNVCTCDDTYYWLYEMADKELTDIMVDMEFGELMKDWIEDWSDDENSDREDRSENGNEWDDLNVSGIVML